MPSSQDQRLEKLIDRVLKSNDYQELDDFLQDIGDGAVFKYSKQFFTKLDKLVNKALDENNARNVNLAFSILSKCGKNLSSPGGQGLSGVVAQNLVKKMVQWFERCRELWIQGGPKRKGMLLTLAESFFDALMVVHEESKEGTYAITQSFLNPIGQLAADPRIYILIQKEAVRKLNLILSRIPEELKNENNILSSQEASDMMVVLARHILDCGDYDLQIILIETLIRMTSSDQRRELAGRWFTTDYVSSAFAQIEDSEFETDCRKFLNLVNGMQGDRRRVYTHPCLEVFLDRTKLLIPPDEKLEEFWIDFNLSSQCISFYFCLADAESEEWDTMSIAENEVESFTVADQGKSSVLKLKLLAPVCAGRFQGTSLIIHFKPALDILQAACRVYGSIKNKSAVAKKSSVVKTSVKIVMDDSCSQTVPESQQCDTERNSAATWLQPAPPSVKTGVKNKKVSESTTFVTSSSRGSVSSVSPFSATGVPPSKWKVKGALEMARPGEKQDQCNPGLSGVKTHTLTPSSTASDRVRQQTVPESQQQCDTERNSAATWLQPAPPSVKTGVNKKVSESTTFVTSSSRGSVSSVSPFSATGVPPSKWKVKGALEMTRSGEKQDQCNPGLSVVKANKTSGHSMTPSSTASDRVRQQSETPLHSKVFKSTPIKKNIPLAEVVKSVLADLEEDQESFDDGFVPDSQPNMKPNWRKNSVSEMLMMQTQRNSFLQGYQPKPGLKQQEQLPSSVQRTGSDPESAQLSCQQLHKELTHRLQEVIRSTESTPSPSKGSADDESGSIMSRAAKQPQQQQQQQQQQGEKQCLTKGKASIRTKAQVKPTSTKEVLQDQTNVKDPGTVSGKEKRDVEVANSMVKEIYRRYDKTNTSTVAEKPVTSHGNPKPAKGSMSDYSWLPTANKQTPCAAFMKSLNDSSKTSNTRRHDVFAFDSDTVVPRMKLYESSTKESSGFQDPSLQPTTTKKERVLKGKQPLAKKHLFSDTASDVETEVSWVKSSYRKPKVQIRDYSRKTKAPDSPAGFPAPSPKPVTKKYNPKETPWPKGKAGRTGQQEAVSRRPRRAAAGGRKSYREPDTDDSKSDSEQEGDENNKKTDKQKESDAVFKPVVTKGVEPKSSGLEKCFGEKSRAKMTKKMADSNKSTKTYWEQDEDGQAESENHPAPKKCAMEKRKMAEETQAKRTNSATAKTNHKIHGEADHVSQIESEQLPCFSKKYALEKTKKMGQDAEAKTTNSASTKKPTKGYRESDHDSQSDSKQPARPKKCVMEKIKKTRDAAEPKMITSTATKKHLLRSDGESFLDSQSECDSEQSPWPKKHGIMQRKTENASHKTPESAKKNRRVIREPTEEEMAEKTMSYTWDSYKKMRSTAEESDPIQPLPVVSPLPSLPGLSPIPPTFPTQISSLFQASQSPHSPSTAEDLESVHSVVPSSPQEVELSSQAPEFSSQAPEFSPRAAEFSPQAPELSPHRGSGTETVSPVMTLSQSSFSSFNKTSVSISRLEITPATATAMTPPPPSKNVEKTTFSDKEKSTDQQEYLMSGPSRKRQFSSSEEEEEEEQERTRVTRGQRSAKMKPRKLFKSYMEESPGGEERQEVSHVLSSRRWEARLEGDDADMDTETPDDDPSDMGSFCRQFSTELKKKYQNRSSQLQSYTKQSMKIAQQHMSSFIMQTSQNRTRNLQDVQQVLVAELNNLERDDMALKNMEKEFTTFWKKQSMALYTYHESGTQRLTTLKTTLQSHVCHSVEYEQKTLTTQMCLMRKDMKSAQDKLLKDMHEEELRKVKRGLQALFQSGRAMF